MSFWILAELPAKPGKSDELVEVARELTRETHKEPGMFGYMLSQQVKSSKNLASTSNPDSFFMLEHYKDRDAFGKHMKSGHFSQWGPKLMNVMTSAPLRILAPAIQGTDMVKVIHHHAKPGTFAIVAEMNLRNSASRAEFEAVMREMMQETHKEPGILAYTLCQEAKGSSKLNEKVNEDLYYMVEVYGDYAAFSSHMKSGHYQKLSPKLGELINAGNMRILAPVFPAGSKL